MSFLSGFFGGSKAKPAKEKIKALPVYNERQTQLLNTLQDMITAPLQTGTQGISNILSDKPENFEAFSAPARRRYEQQTIPGIAETFSNLLGGDSINSSGFQQTLAQSANEFETDLEAQRQALKSDSFNQLMPLLQSVLQPRTQYMSVRKEGSPGSGGLFGGLAGGGGNLLGAMLTKKILGF